MVDLRNDIKRGLGKVVLVQPLAEVQQEVQCLEPSLLARGFAFTAALS